MRLLYLAHDLDDSAIWRRVSMLRRGGADVHVAGFRRGDAPLPEAATVLGKTANGRMAQRVGAVAAALPRLVRRLGNGPAPVVILARNLEMLALGLWMQRSVPSAALVYELLDVHRLMLGNGLVSRGLRRAEAVMLRRTALVLISSPGFSRHYLAPYARPVADLHLIENKPLTTEQAVPPQRDGPATPGRITIGWFGILRCQWSLMTLDALTRAAPGRYNVVLRGRPAPDALPDFSAVVAANPDMQFHGAYCWPDDLAAIYAGVDLAWLIDRYDAGANSDWLLPNRLYEGGLHGAVPLALHGTEVATRLAALGIGLTAADATMQAVAQATAPLDDAAITVERRRVAALPVATWQADDGECRALVARLAAAQGAHASPRAASALRQGAV